MGFVAPAALPEIEPKPGWHGRFFHSKHMTFAYYTIDAGASLHAHAHSNEEVWHVIDGSVELTVGEETRTVRAGEAAVIPPDVLHAVRADRTCRVIVVDHPVRTEVAGIRIAD